LQERWLRGTACDNYRNPHAIVAPVVAQMQNITMSNDEPDTSRAAPSERTRNERLRTAAVLSAAFVAMLAGMAAKVGYDHFTGAAPFAWSAFFVPMMVAPMVYGGVYNMAKGSTDTVVMLIFSFQNGFFWQVIVGQLGPPVSGGG
jgi:hypothetical protein